MKIHFLIALVIGAGLLVTSTAAMAQSKDTGPVFTKAEVEPEYPGGHSAWVKFLDQTQRYPAGDVSNGIQGTVIVQFIVHADSSISDIKVLSGPPTGGLGKESMRVVAASGKWVPARQNGHAVNCYKQVPIKFVLMK